MKKLIIFDMDGVLIDTEKIHDLSWKVTFEHFGLDVSEEDRHMFLGRGFKEYMEHLKELVSADDKVNDNKVNDIREYQRNFYHDYFRNNKTEVKKGVYDLLNILKEMNVLLAVASATKKKSGEKSLKSVGLYNYFDYHIFGDMVEMLKPHPEIFLSIVKYFNLERNETLILEDSYYGVKAANNAEIDVYWIKDIVDISNFENVFYNKKYDSMSEASSDVISAINDK